MVDDFFHIFRDIRQIRKGKGLTLGEMSRKTGISLTYLSQIERGKTNPSIGVLKKITNVLDVPLMGLGSKENIENSHIQRVAVVRRDMRKVLMYPKSKVKEYLLTPDLNRKLEVLLSDSQPGKEKEDVVYSHEGEEFGFVLEGRYEVTVDGKTYILEEGDSIYFSSHLPHRIRGIGKKRCKTIWVITPPSF